MNEYIPIAIPVKPKKKRVKHFIAPDSEYRFIKCGVRKREGELVDYITDLRTSLETREVIGHHYNYTEDPREVTCKRCLRSISWR